MMGKYQNGFRQRKSTNDTIQIMRHFLENKDTHHLRGGPTDLRELIPENDENKCTKHGGSELIYDLSF